MAATMTSLSMTKQPLGERSSNIPSPIKSPSKVPLPPSPTSSPLKLPERVLDQPSFADETGSMDQTFKASTLLQKPDLVRKISEAHSTGQTYVSPSDNILSPTTKKLSEVKNKRFGGFKKSNLLYQSHNLFARASSKADLDISGGGTKS